MTDRHKIALVGCGDVAHRDYLPEFTRIADRAELVGVCGRTRDRAERTADEYGIAQVHDDLDDLLATSEATIVMNLTPLRVHDEINIAIVDSGRHLYSEKTVASCARQAALLGELAIERGVTIAAAPCSMVWPQLDVARRVLPELGTVRSARGLGFGGVPPWPGFESDPTPFFQFGAGPHRDLGIYAIHALVGLLGPVRSVAAMSARAQEHFEIGDGEFRGTVVKLEEDDTWLISMTHESGALSSVEANFSAHNTRAPELELLGTGGTMALSLLDVSQPVSVSLVDDHGEWRDLPVANVRDEGPDHIMGVEHLLDCLDGTATPMLGIDDAIHALAILDAAIDSVSIGGTITL